MEPFIVENIIFLLIGIGSGVGVAMRTHHINRKFDYLERRIVDESNDLRRDIDGLRRDVDKRLEDENRVFSALLGELNERVDETINSVRVAFDDDRKESQATEEHCACYGNDCICK
jgi:hypothetical protein